jgi:hypothetical protein
MSRLVGMPVAVVTNPSQEPCVINGAPEEPCMVNGSQIMQILSHHREWIGALEGETERDVWKVETVQGVLELHHLHASGQWLHARWED